MRTAASMPESFYTMMEQAIIGVAYASVI